MIRKFTGLVFTSLFIFSFSFAPLAQAQTVTIAQLQAQIATLEQQLSALIASQQNTTTTSTVVVPTTDQQFNKFSIGDTVQVIQDGLNVRATPYGTITGSEQFGALGMVTAGPSSSSNTNWYNINYQNGVDGWSIERGLTKSSLLNNQNNTPSVSLTADKTSVSSGTIVTLNWKSVPSSGSSCWTGNGYSDWNGTLPSSGYRTVNPFVDTTGILAATGSPATGIVYEINCTDSVTGKNISSSVYISLGSTNNTPTATISAYPTSIQPGQSSTLTWSSTNATACSEKLSTLPTTAITIQTSSVGLNSAYTTVSPAQTVTYTITCANSAGISSVPASVTVNVGSNNFNPNAAPTIYSVTPATVGQGGQVTVTGLGSTGSSFLQGTYIAIDGNQSVDPISQTTYSLTFVVPSNLSQGNHTIKIGEKAGNVSSVSQTLSVISGVNLTPLPLGQQKINAWLAAPINWSSVTAAQLTQIFQQAIRSQGGATTYLDYNTGAVTTIPTGAVPSPNFAIQGKFLQGQVVSESERAYVGYNDSNGVDAYYNIAADGTVTARSNTITPAPTVSISASPTSITAGQSSTLSWTSTNAVNCAVLQNSSASGTSGNLNVFPTQSSTYTVTCTSSNGQVATANVTVNVGTTVPTLSAPTLSALTGTQCDSISLSWTPVAGATYYKILRDGYLIGTVATSYVDSSLYTPLTPSSLHTYTVSATDGTRNSPNSNAVNVTSSASCSTSNPPAPTVTVTANPTSITAGQSSYVSMTSTNATSCSGPASAGTSDYFTVTPTQTTAYTFNCTGAGGSATGSVTVNVTPASTPTTPAPTISIFASPLSITTGQAVGISFSSTNATSCTGNFLGGTATNGYTYVYPTQTITYTVSCTGAGGSASNSQTVTVYPPTTSVGGTFITAPTLAASTYAAIQGLLQQLSQQLK